MKMLWAYTMLFAATGGPMEPARAGLACPRRKHWQGTSVPLNKTSHRAEV